LDAIELLLQDKCGAEKLLKFHRKNRTFLPHMVAELLWLIQHDRKAGGVEALVHFLRWDNHWHAVDEFEVNQNLGPLAIRVCALLWPDINGIVRLAHCEADEILGTYIVRGRKSRYGNLVRPTAKTGTAWVNARRPEVPEIKRRVSGKSVIAEAIRYGLNHWDGLTRFLEDGRIELDTNIVERGMRPIALNRKNALFAGHDQGAENWAAIASLVETCKLHGVDPQAYFADVLTKLVNLWPQSRLDELMPWAWAAQRSTDRLAA
jgi:hypothetical protein